MYSCVKAELRSKEKMMWEGGGSEENREWEKSSPRPSWKIFEMNMHSDAICCILRV